MIGIISVFDLEELQLIKPHRPAGGFFYYYYEFTI